MPRESVVKVSYEVVPVLRRQGHEGPSHDNKLDLGGELSPNLVGLPCPRCARVSLVDQPCFLFGGRDCICCQNNGQKIPRSNGPHARGLVTGIRLGGVLKVRVRATGAIDANVPRHGDVPVRVKSPMNTNGHRCGLLITATTAIPEAVRIGFVLSVGSRASLYCSGRAAMISTVLGCSARPYFEETLDFRVDRLIVLDSSCALIKRETISDTAFMLAVPSSGTC